MKTYESKHKNVRQVTKDKLLSLWDDKMPHDTLLSIINKLCREVNSPFSLKVYLLISVKDYDALLDCTVDPNNYVDAQSYLADAMLFGLIKKYPHWDINLDPREEAIKKFIAAETSCRKTNRFFTSGAHNRTPGLSGVLHTASRIIASILGQPPSLEDLVFTFGPGSNYNVKNNTSALDKLRSSLDVTSNGIEIGAKFLQTCPGWLSCHTDDFSLNNITRFINVIPGDRLSFVPKDAKTLRPIAIGGTISGVIQKAIGIRIRDKLKPVIDLRNTQSFHRSFVQEASRTGLYATIDLSSASDTISFELVRDLIPPSWFELLVQARSHSYVFENRSYVYEKFSAMGNGYTFELETLLFYALTRATMLQNQIDGKVSVYGDDIILPSRAYTLVSTTLEQCGFTVNKLKSFATGYFRESCGGDYFNGKNVRPFYLKDNVSLRTLFLMHNFYVRNHLDLLFPNTFNWIRKIIGRDVCTLMRGNYFEGDGFLLDRSADRLPKYFVLEKTQYRKTPKYLSFNYLKAYALYRQLSVNYDQLLRYSEKVRRLYITVENAEIGYMGSPMDQDQLPAMVWSKQFKLKSTSDITGFYSSTSVSKPDAYEVM
jgi:hypothetical protein